MKENNLKLAICKVSGRKWCEIISPSREQILTFSRNLFCFEMRKKYRFLTLSEIGKMINRDHATVLHGCRKHAEDIEFPTSQNRLSITEKSLCRLKKL